MNFKFSIIFGTFLCLNLSQAVENASTPSDEAVIECGNIHHIELQNFPQANASFSNGKCRLTCWIRNTILATDSIYEGRSCPEDSTGICRNGQCIGGQEEALRECGLKHNLDFHKIKDHKGTAFTHDQCMLKCVLDGAELSTNSTHEGSPCPGNLNGVCLSGTCVTQSTNPGTTVTLQPTTVTKPSIDTFSPSKMKLLNISIESTDPSLNPHHYIYIFFHETDQPVHSIVDFYGDPTKPNVYYLQQISNIPSKLNSHSRLGIIMYESGHWLNEQYVNLYTLFGTFYKNHKLTFGEQENFVHKIALYPQDKVMNVAVRFRIVFSKD